MPNVSRLHQILVMAGLASGCAADPLAFGEASAPLVSTSFPSCATETSEVTPAITAVDIHRVARVGEIDAHMPSNWTSYGIYGFRCDVLESAPLGDGNFAQTLDCNAELAAWMQTGGGARRDLLVPLIWDVVMDPDGHFGRPGYTTAESYGVVNRITVVTRLADFERAAGIGLEYEGKRYFASKEFLASSNTVITYQTLLDGTPAITHRLYTYGLRVQRGSYGYATDTFRPFLVDIDAVGNCRLQLDATPIDPDFGYEVWTTPYRNSDFKGFSRWHDFIAGP
jgi:hypothetical protein